MSDERAWGLPSSGWLFVALALFLLQVLPFLSYRWVTDESWYAGPGYSIALGHGIADPAIGPNDIENHFDARPPGTALVIAAFFRIFGVGASVARFGSVLAGMAVVLVTWRIARDALGVRAAAVAALLAAVDNFLVLASRTARPEALTTFAIAAALLAMLRFREGRPVWAFLAGLSMAMGAMFHVTLLGYVVSLGLLAILVDRRHGGSGLIGGLVYSTGFACGLVPFVLWILTAPLGRAGFQAEYLSRALGEPLSAKFIHEMGRYAGFLGFGALHRHGLEHAPVRLAVPMLLLVASYALWRYRRGWFYVELLLLVPSLLWLVDTANKSSRYLSIFAPVLALICAAAYKALDDRPPLRNALVVLAGLAVGTQVAANAMLLNGARHADYTTLGARLRAAVPPGETVYGTITFWLAFHDHPYLSYERTDPWMAANDFHARYFIAGDRMMTMGSESDGEFYRTMNRHFHEVIERSTAVARIPDPYYGSLIVYKLAR